MRTCPHCHAIVGEESVCGACEQASESGNATAPAEPSRLTDFAEIEHKIRQSRFTRADGSPFFSEATWRWAGRWAVAWLLVNAVLAPVVARAGPPWFDLAIWIMPVVFFIPLLPGGARFVLAAMRPVFIALFCSPERFEREYGGVGERSRGAVKEGGAAMNPNDPNAAGPQADPSRRTEYAEIEQKIRQSRFANAAGSPFYSEATLMWARRWMLAWFLITAVVAPVLTRAAPHWGDLIVGIMAVGFLIPFLPALAGKFLAAVRPVFVALFCSAERFEREYGRAGGCKDTGTGAA